MPINHVSLKVQKCQYPRTHAKFKRKDQKRKKRKEKKRQDHGSSSKVTILTRYRDARRGQTVIKMLDHMGICRMRHQTARTMNRSLCAERIMEESAESRLSHDYFLNI